MTLDDLLVSLKRLVPEAERDGIESEDTYPIWQAQMRGLQAEAERQERRKQSSYLLPHSSQTSPPAGYASPAVLEVTLERIGNIDRAVLALERKIQLIGPSGRTYWNTEPVAYARRDESPVRVVRFECQVPGEVGNIDFLCNDDLNGPKGLPEGWLRAEHLTLMDLSRGRTNIGATLLQAEGSTAIKDSGRPATFEAGDSGLYVEILYSVSPVHVGKVYRIREHRAPGLEEPVGSNIRPTTALLDDAEVPEQWKSVTQDDGGVFTAYTGAANDLAEDDFPLLPAAPVVGDAIYFGAQFPITALGLRVDTVAEGVYELAWETWNGVAWVAPAKLKDGSIGFTATGLRRVHIGNVDTQLPTTVNGVLAYWVRARVSAFTSLATQPLGGYAFPLCFEPLPDEAGTIEWGVRDWKDLGFTVTQVRHVELGRDPDLYTIGDNRGMHPGDGEPAESFRARISKVPDVDTPAALQRVVNRVLGPLKLKGRVIDVGDEVDGFFFDQDAYDYYQDGDKYPTSPWKLMLSAWEAYGFFYVMVPYIGLGDFGMFYDEGPLFLDEKKGEYLGPFYDYGFYDGYAVGAAEQFYKLIHDEVRRRKMGGPEFVLLPDQALNTP